MNHSIYSADRTTHLKIVVVALVAGIAVAGFGISARTIRTTVTRRPRASSRPARPWRSPVRTHRWFANEFCEFTRLFTSPPKSPREYVEDPNYPKLTTTKTPAPHGRFLFVRIADLIEWICCDGRRGRRHGLDQLAGETIGAVG